MSRLHVKYLLVGGGVASSHAAVEIRKLDPAGICSWWVRRSTGPTIGRR